MKDSIAPRLAIWMHERSLSLQDREAIIGDLVRVGNLAAANIELAEIGAADFVRAYARAISFS